MTAVLPLLAALIALALAYAFLRPWLKKKPWAAGYFASIEAIEAALFKKSETILVGRLLWVGGLFVTAYDGLAVFASSLDLTPLTTRAFDALQIPPDMRGLAATALLALIGRIITWLRARTTKPLEVVAAPDVLPPAAAAAVARAEVTKDAAVAAVQGTQS